MTNQQPWGSNGPIGDWRIEGMTPSGEDYRGRLHIERVNAADTLRAQWETDIGVFTGLGLLHNGRLLVSRVPDDKPTNDEPGIVWYTMTGSGDLEAVWSIGELAGQIGTGFTEGGVSGQLPGCRTIHYYLPIGNSSPPLQIEIVPDGQAFAIVWRDGDKITHDGVGLATPTGLASAWAPRPEAKPPEVKTLLILTASSPSEARAVSAMQGSDELGSERLRRKCGNS